MLFKRTLLTLLALFTMASGMPVYAEQAPTPKVTEQKDDAAASTETESVIGIKKLYAEEPETLTTGSKFNEAIKTLAAGVSMNNSDFDYLINTVQIVDAVPSGNITTKDVSAKQDGSYLIWWDTGTKIIKLYSKSGKIILNPDSSNMFRGCFSLTTLDVSGFDTSLVTSMGMMFYQCFGLTTLDVSSFDTSQVTNMGSMFYGCSKLATLDVSNWNTSNVRNMGYMFSSCSSLTTLDVSKLNTSKVIAMDYMFNGCSSLTTLDLSSWDTSGAKTMNSMFSNCSNLAVIYIGRGWNIGNAAPCINMFSGCTKLPNFDSSVVNYIHANALPDGYMFMKNPELRYLAKSSFVLSGTSDYGNSVNMAVSSDKNGRLSFKNLEKGTYTLTEVSPTDGYIKNSVKYTVTVTDSGVSVVSDNPAFYYETADQKVLFNEPYHTFTIQKTSSMDSTVGVAGAEFLLSGVSDYGTEVSQSKVTGDTGVATFDHLEAGSYLLTETKAPEHFALDPVSRIVTISKYGVVKIDGLSKEGSFFVWTDIRNADGTITITKNWKDTLTGTDAANRALPIIVISDQRTIPDAVTITYHAGNGYFGTDQTNKTNAVTYTEKVDKDGNILSVSASKGQELTPSMTGKTFDAWYLDSALTTKAPDAIADYIEANPSVNAIALYAKYKDPPMLTTGAEFNAAIKTLAAGISQIESVQVVDTPPSEGITTKDVSASNDGSYLAWWDADAKTVKLYPKYGKIILNPNSNSMFYGCSSLTTLDVSNWNTSLVTNMSYMFTGCSKLTPLDVSNWDTSRVTSMYAMFNSCSSLTTLDVSGWDTGSVTNMRYMFNICSKLTTLNVSKWKTNKVTNMSSMFKYCTSFTTLDISNWDTSQVKDMSSMFYNCSSLATLDVSKWDTSNVTNMSEMFRYCSSLEHIYIGSGWNTDHVTSSDRMFYNCTKLPNFNSSVVDKTNAHAGSGGYMTLKP